MAINKGFFHSFVALILCFSSFVLGILPIQGTHTGGVKPRLEIRALARNANQWNIYLLALQAFKAENQEATSSYYQISGIHGVPYKAWDGVQGAGPQTGYCVHSSNLFPTWHRPYVALFEQRLTYHARQVAAQFKGAERQAMVAAANNLRQPFWDWAGAPASGQPVMPAMLTQRTYSVRTPTGQKTIPNPLYQYGFHPMTPNIFAQPWNRWPETVRWPSTAGGQVSSQQSKAIATFAKQTPSQRAGLYQWFTNCKQYLEMSNDEVKSASPGCHISLEALHNNIHVWAGGTVQPQGHMTIIPFSGYDPMFMLHHTQIDRLFAMWQTIYPNSYTTAQTQKAPTFTWKIGSVQGPTSPLKPFHRSANGDFWTSNEVRNHRVFGYTYPDHLIAPSSAAMRARVNRMYGPNPTVHTKKRDLGDLIAPLLAPNNTRYEYIANIATSRFGLNGTYNIFMFLGAPTTEDPAAWPTDSNLAGSYGVFSQSGMEDSPIITTSSVSLTDPLASKVDNGFLNTLEELVVIPFLSKALTWRVQGPNNEVVDPSNVPDLKISVVSSTTTIPDDPTEFPVWSEFYPLPKVTHGKPGGLMAAVGDAIGDAIGDGLGQLGKNIGDAINGGS